MSHQVQLRDDGIVWVILSSKFDQAVAEAVVNDLKPHLEAATPDSPLLLLSDVRGSTRPTPEARRILANLGRDPRLAKNAIVGIGRYARVMAGFMNKAAGRDNIRFFDTEENALAWLQSAASSEVKEGS